MADPIIRHMIYSGDKLVSNYMFYYKESAEWEIEQIGIKTARVVKVKIELIEDELCSIGSEEGASRHEETQESAEAQGFSPKGGASRPQWYSQSVTESDLQAAS